ncbi:hypothetical protein, partial [Klebsiella pneumoniae]|uniref:hypothetical protein n=1 Tax=Klebsiella pneumoniae TaxID=573 RepID=UPI003854B2FC
VAGVDGSGLRAQLARGAAGDAVRAAARAGVALFDSPEGGESLLGEAAGARLMLHVDSTALRPDHVEGRLSLMRERLSK